PMELAGETNREGVWNTAYRLAEEAGMSVRVASVSPGYDDMSLADSRRVGNPRRVVERHEGEAYAQALHWAEILEPPPRLVVVSTFNEFHENTHIEPSVRYGA